MRRHNGCAIHGAREGGGAPGRRRRVPADGHAAPEEARGPLEAGRRDHGEAPGECDCDGSMVGDWTNCVHVNNLFEGGTEAPSDRPSAKQSTSSPITPSESPTQAQTSIPTMTPTTNPTGDTSDACEGYNKSKCKKVKDENKNKICIFGAKKRKEKTCFVKNTKNDPGCAGADRISCDTSNKLCIYDTISKTCHHACDGITDETVCKAVRAKSKKWRICKFAKEANLPACIDQCRLRLECPP